jgi:predicted homoserine dehydrogenase-like protein
MSLYFKLQQRAAAGNPVRIGLIGAGKFGSMYLAQVPRTPGVHLAGIADLSPEGARANLARVGWKPEQSQAASSTPRSWREPLTSARIGRPWCATPRST